MPMRWRWPPENSCGKRPGVLGAQARPVSSSSAMRRRARRLPRASPWVESASPSDRRAIRICGFRLAYGSWKMICSCCAACACARPTSGRCRRRAKRTLPGGGSRAGAARRGRSCSCRSRIRRRGRASRRAGSRRDVVDRAHRPLLAAEVALQVRPRSAGGVDECGARRAPSRRRRSRRCAVTAFIERRRGRHEHAARLMPRRCRRAAARPAHTRLRLVAARLEGAAGRRRERARDLAADRDQPPRPRLPGRVRLARQAARAAPACRDARGVAKSGRTGALSTTRPAYITTTPVGDLGDDAEVVRDEQDRPCRSRACSRAHQREDLRLDRHVERGRRLVGDQQRRVAGHRDRDHHALAHAARQLVRVLVEALRGVRDLAPARACAAPRRAPPLRPRPLCSAQRSRRSARRRVKTGFRLRHRLLEDHRDLRCRAARACATRGSASRSTPVARAIAEPGLAADAASPRCCGSRRISGQAGDRLARARFADERRGLAGARSRS